MKHHFKTTLFAVALALATPAQSQDAISIDADGNVSIPGNLTAGNISSANLEQALAELKAQNDKILTTLQWFEFAPNVGVAFERVTEDRSLPLKLEFMMARNTGARQLTFSRWNHGLRLTTSPYMTGDVTPYTLGGSMWVYNTDDPNSKTCTGGQAYHYYYYIAGAATYKDPTSPPRYINNGNKCSTETTVYARPRLLP